MSRSLFPPVPHAMTSPNCDLGHSDHNNSLPSSTDTKSSVFFPQICFQEASGLKHTSRSKQVSDDPHSYSFPPIIPPTLDPNMHTLESCLKCLLKVPHRKCEAHKYIRVGGGYRHGYWYIKFLLEEIETKRKKVFEREKLMAAKQQGYSEDKAITIHIKTESGKQEEKIIKLLEGDYRTFRKNKKSAGVLMKYLTQKKSKSLESWDNDLVDSFMTHAQIRRDWVGDTFVYSSRNECQTLESGRKASHDILERGKKAVGLDGTDFDLVRSLITTRSGGLQEKLIHNPDNGYQAMTGGSENVDNILKRSTEQDGSQNSESWEDSEQMRTVKTKVTTRSGQAEEKLISINPDDYKRISEDVKQGQDPSLTLQNYLDSEGGENQSWEIMPDETPTEVLKASFCIRSGHLTEQAAQPTEGEYNDFQACGGIDPSYLGTFIDNKARVKAETMQKASLVHLYDDEFDALQAKTAKREMSGETYKPDNESATGKRNMKKINHTSNSDSGVVPVEMADIRKDQWQGKDRKGGTEYDDEKITWIKREKNRDQDSDSDDLGEEGRNSTDSAFSGSCSSEGSWSEKGEIKKRWQQQKGKHHYGMSRAVGNHVVSSGRTEQRQQKKKTHREKYPNEQSQSELESGYMQQKIWMKQRKHERGSGYVSHGNTAGEEAKLKIRKKKSRDIVPHVKSYVKAEAYNSETDTESVVSEDIERTSLTEREILGNGVQRMTRMEVSNHGELSSNLTEEADLEIMTVEENKKCMTGKFLRSKNQGKTRKANVLGKTEEVKLRGMEHSEKGTEKIKRDRSSTAGDNNGTAGNRMKKTKKLTKDNTKKEQVTENGSKSEQERRFDRHGEAVKNKKKLKKDQSLDFQHIQDKNETLAEMKMTESASLSEEGEYFEVNEEGEIQFLQSKRRINLNKMTADNLRHLQIDMDLSKQEIAQTLKDKFGSDIEIVDERGQIGTRHLSEYESDVDTDHLAEDSDLDTSTLKGPRRVNVLMRRGGEALLDHMKRVLEQSKLQDNTYTKDLDERSGDIDFLSHYKLIDSKLLEPYARAFVVEDENFKAVLGSKETKQAIQGVSNINHITNKQLEYVLKVLKIDEATQVTFRMFAVISALCERVTQMDQLSKHLIEICDLMDIDRKIGLYKAMFYTNVSSDRDANFIKADSLKIELIAGGLNWNQQEFIMEKLQPNCFSEISFLDYICYIPLFLSMHDNIVDNPLDMANNKYDSLLRRPSGLVRQRDHNPLGNPLKRDSHFQNQQLARDILEGKISMSDIKHGQRELVTKYATYGLPALVQENQKVPHLSTLR